MYEDVGPLGHHWQEADLETDVMTRIGSSNTVLLDTRTWAITCSLDLEWADKESRRHTPYYEGPRAASLPPAAQVMRERFGSPAPPPAGCRAAYLQVSGAAPAPRGGHTATLVPHDGRLAILVLGGRDYNEAAGGANPHFGRDDAHLLVPRRVATVPALPRELFVAGNANLVLD